MIAWDQVPVGHRRRDYLYRPDTVRVQCECRWLSTWAPSVQDARQLWVIHIRSLARTGR